MDFEKYIKPYNKLLNIVLSKKFEWFKEIKLNDIKVGNHKGYNNFLSPIGKIYVDSSWGYKQWKEYHYDSPFPIDEEVSFGDIIGGGISAEVQDQFTFCFSQIRGYFKPKYISFSWLEIVLVDEDEDILQEHIKKLLKEESEIPNQVRRRMFTQSSDDIFDKIKKSSLGMLKGGGSINTMVDFGAKDVAKDIVPWHDEQGRDYDNNDYQKWIEITKKYIIDKFGEETKNYLQEILSDGIFDEDGNKYIFWKHSERNGGSGFGDTFNTWGDLLKNYGGWFPLKWNEIKSKLDKMEKGELLFLKPGDKNNNYGYYFSIVKKKTNLQEHIQKVLKETLESEWNKGNYDYQHGYCHYFAYNIIEKIRKKFPKKDIKYYLLLASEVDKETQEPMQEYLIHVYIKIDDLLLDSNGFTTQSEAWQRAQEWEERQSHLVSEQYETEVWEEESNEIPEYFFNNSFCNSKKVKQDLKDFLSHPSVQKLLK